MIRDWASYDEAYTQGEHDGLRGAPRASTALAYRKGYDAAFGLYLRLTALQPYIESTRYALTAEDVRWDYETGRDRYAA
jgi:hypothetical protein